MIVDYVAQELEEAQSLIERLAEQECQAAQAKRARDRSATRAAEQQAQTLRSQLLQQTDASLVYLYLSASSVASDVALRTVWQNGAMCVDVLDTLRRWGVEGLYEDYWRTCNPDLTILPAYSFSLRFTFTLAQPYISKDDNAFYIIDNPIVRDKVFHLPMVRPSSWKGNLYATLWQLGHRKEADERVKRLLGEIRGDEEGQAGRVIFFPTFFTQISLEIINPHDRKTKVGKNPILFESVPQNEQGAFTLLYVPFDRVGQDPDQIRQELAEDLPVLARGLQAMFCVYGFSAKRTSGFGLADETLAGQGELVIHMEDETAQAEDTAPQADPMQELQQEIEAFVRRFHLQSFPRWTNAELAESDWGNKRQSEYKRLRNRRPDWDVNAGMWREPEEGPASGKEESPPAPLLTRRTFESFSGLVEAAGSLAQRMASQTGGER